MSLSDSYVFDPKDPRAPTEAQWERLEPKEREQVIEMLPSEFDFEDIETMPPEGDLHTLASVKTRFTLDAFFKRIGRKIYFSSNLAVYYPGEACFAPDVIAVVDVETHPRQKWVVQAEGKGIDLAFEVHVAGNRSKDAIQNVERYARLGIHEYFFFDQARMRLYGYRLNSANEDANEGKSARGSRIYRPILPQDPHDGRLASRVLGLDLIIEGDKLRFLYGMAPVPEADELIEMLGKTVDDAELRAKEEAERAREEEERAKAEAEKAKTEAEKAKAEAEKAKAEAERAKAEAERAKAEAERANALEKRVAELEAEVARLKRD